ncbi:MAG: DNA polymerase III subunit alpha [Gammaproteobacteria bacterium]|nr:DNA polymerase III subunit alpha [Gammaproteobacteria bacterium]
MSTPQAVRTFVHLRLHTEFSISDGLIAVGPLVERLREQRMPAVAVTDLGNLFSLIKFYQAARRAGVKPVCGCDLRVVDEASGAESRIALLVGDETGYRNLIRLVSDIYVESEPGDEFRIGKSRLQDYSDGLIALSGALESDIAAALLAGETELARSRLDAWRGLFPRGFYLELQRLGSAGEEDYIAAALALAADSGCPVVATNNVRFLREDDFEAHEARVCITQRRVLDDPGRPREYTPRQYLRGAAEMIDLFSDIPEAVAATVDIAKRCNLDLEPIQRLPDFPLPAGETASLDEYLSRVAAQGLAARLEARPGEAGTRAKAGTRAEAGAKAEAENQAENATETGTSERYQARLREELAIINQMDFAGYFLVVMEFVRWAKEKAIPVGPGRGSGAGSIVAWALGITDVDPLEYDLLFERFLNPERVSMPDFDIDFCMEGRDRVIAHVAEIYGQEAVSQIITFGTMAAKAVVRDVARVQGKPYSLGDRLSRLIPGVPGMTLEKALAEQPELREFVNNDDEAGEILEMARKLEGLARNVGKHAGGVVIAPGKLTDFTPLYRDHDRTGASLLTQYDKDDVETAGLVKFDFLGLKTLTIIDWAVKAVNEREGGRIDIARLPLDDGKVYRMLGKGDTTAVFQLESRGLKQLIRKLKPSRFDDLVALVALYRPGPLQSGMVDDFINRKHGRTEVDYPLPALEPVLKSTYGVILYQEQVMKIAQLLGKYTLGRADILRKAMGKKDPAEMARQRDAFMAGALEQGVPERKASDLFDLMEKFAGYGFNKSHSVAYALLAYQTAWLKRHYPAYFMAAVLSAEMNQTEKITDIVAECRKMGLTVLPPSINRGEYRFGVDGSGQIEYGLGAIRNLGRGQIERIARVREQGAFRSLPDLCRRIGGQLDNKNVIEILIDSGACDELAAGEALATRARLKHCLPEVLQAAEQHLEDQALGIANLFADAGGEAGEGDELPESAKPFKGDRRAVLEAECASLGYYLSEHPIAAYRSELKHFAPLPLDQAKTSRNSQRFAGMLADFRIRPTESGQMAILTLDDGTAKLETVLYEPLLGQVRERLEKNRIVVIEGKVEKDKFNDGPRLRANELMSLAEARARHARGLSLRVDGRELNGDFCARLAGLLEPYRRNGKNHNGGGACQVLVDYRRGDLRGCIMLGSDWAVAPVDALVSDLRAEFGRDQVALQYPSASRQNPPGS